MGLNITIYGIDIQQGLIANRILGADQYCDALSKMGHNPKVRLLPFGEFKRDEETKAHFLSVLERDIEEDKPDAWLFFVMFPYREIADFGIPTYIFPEHIPDPKLAQWPINKKNVFMLAIAPSFHQFFHDIGFKKSQIKDFSYASHHESIDPIDDGFDYDVVFLGTDGAANMRLASFGDTTMQNLIDIYEITKEDTSRHSISTTKKAMQRVLGKKNMKKIPKEMHNHLAFCIQGYSHLLRVRETVLIVHEHCRKMKYKFGLAGSGWNKMDQYKDVVEIDPALNASIYNKSKVTFQRNCHTNSLSRFYKSIMSGCLPIIKCIASDADPGGILTMYPRDMLVMYKDNYELLDRIDFNVKYISQRNDRLRRLQKHTIENNTYVNRFENILGGK